MIDNEKGVPVPPDDTLPRDMINGVKLEHWHAVLNYHQGAMESRRSIEIKVFTGLLALDLILLQGGLYYISSNQESSVAIKLCFHLVIISLYLLFRGLLKAIEDTSAKNRPEYLWISATILAHLMNDPLPLRKKFDETLTEKGKWSWAATWPGRAALVVAILCIIAMQLS